MPTNTQRRTRAGSGSTGALWLGLLIVVILGGGVALSVLKKREAEARPTSQAAPEKPRPFADMPPEQPPPSGAPRGAAEKPFESPASLLSDPQWQRAVELAEEGEALYQQAVEAKSRGDVATLNAVGNEAKRKLDEALESTAELEQDLIARRGESDPLVRDVLRVRNHWFDRVRWLHKSTSR